MSSASPFPTDQYWKVLETDEIFGMGSYINSDHRMQLKYIRPTFYFEGSFGTTANMTMKLWDDSSYTMLAGQSSAVLLSDISDLSSHWRGLLRFDFDDIFLLENQTYYITIQPSNYTRNSYTNYIAVAFDWPLPINTNSNAPLYGASMEFYGLRKWNY